MNSEALNRIEEMKHELGQFSDNNYISSIVDKIRNNYQYFENQIKKLDEKRYRISKQQILLKNNFDLLEFDIENIRNQISLTKNHSFIISNEDSLMQELIDYKQKVSKEIETMISSNYQLELKTNKLVAKINHYSVI